MTININISDKERFAFNNQVDACVGTGRLGLALRQEYGKQLTKVQHDIGFKYIRGHGLFCDDVAIYQTYDVSGVEHVEYNFTYIDQIFDNYLALNIKPFVELGFMPYALASGDQTVFYWKGNVTPPKDYKAWYALIQATLKHWIQRYGIDEVITWPMEVWNEPNLSVFWQEADMDEYFRLYQVSAQAVKDCDSRIQVGGPAICGVDDIRWLESFLKFCSLTEAPLDFVTRHAYATEGPEHIGHYAYQKLRTPEVFLDELQKSRQIIDSFPEYLGMAMHLTEFNTSYTPLNPIHDTNLNAAYVARLLSELGDTCASYSYWTFGDVFEESGVAFTPFSGAFGLLTNGGIPKPTYWTFVFFNWLKGEGWFRNEHCVLTRDQAGNIYGVAYYPVEALDVKEALKLEITLEINPIEYTMIHYCVDELCCNPLKNWIDLGAHSHPSLKEINLIKEMAQPTIHTKRLKGEYLTNDHEGKQTVSMALTLNPNAVQYFQLSPREAQCDRGYIEERIRGAQG